ncbi:MAG: hypothetical protein KatS3mg108_2551 [Isosphaeraceae bacterium]|jgi:uncharacterized protein (DUF433 family)|nr:MAG: hypothetical protein KatS3mg108_2551 [Isosphaeraceae bacterium]
MGRCNLPVTRGIAADTDPRLTLVEWNLALRALVFRGTTARLSDFWPALYGPGGMKGFIDSHPDVSAEAARGVIKLAAERFCYWPSDPAEQDRARHQPDPRFEVAESTPRIRGGRLCFKGRSLYFEILWDNLCWDEESGALSFDEIVTDWELPRDAAKRAIEIGGQLFSEGLAPAEDSPGAEA